mgnify:CR=1 FL=1
MGRRVNKYDTQAFQNIMLPGDRRLKKAFYFIEKLKESDSEFRAMLDSIGRDTKAGRLSEKEGSVKIHEALLAAIEREKSVK